MKIFGLGLPEIGLILIAFVVIFTVLSYNKAIEKGYEAYVGILLGIFLTWIGFIIVCLMPDKKAKEAESLSNADFDQLLKYKKLFDAQVISREEFEAKKRKLL